MMGNSTISNDYTHSEFNSELPYGGIVEFKESAPEWEWCVGGHWNSMTFFVSKHPHRLGRFLQNHFLDIHWRKID